MIPALRRQKEVDLGEFKTTLVYKSKSKTARAIRRNHVLIIQIKKIIIIT